MGGVDQRGGTGRREKARLPSDLEILRFGEENSLTILGYLLFSYRTLSHMTSM
jgi:hypothetical protein